MDKKKKENTGRCKECGKELQSFREKGFLCEKEFCPVCAARKRLDHLDPKTRRDFLKKMSAARKNWVDRLES